MPQPMKIQQGMDMTAGRKSSAEKITRSFCELFQEEYHEEKIKPDRYHGVEGLRYVIKERKLKGNNALSITLTLLICPNKVRISVYSTGRKSDSLSKWFSDGLDEHLIYAGPQNQERDQQGYLFQIKWNGNWIDDQSRTEEVIKKFQEPIKALASHLTKKGLFDESVLSDEDLENLASPDDSSGRLADSSNHAKNLEDEVKKDLQCEIKSLLESNLQIILTGAPGTGKTYTAREVAKVIVGAMVSKEAPEDEKEKAKKTEEERIASIQFHPGYDYSDFVIGMKPKLVGEKQEQVAFDWADGVFKKFADDAKKALDDAKEKSEEPPKFVFLIDEINRADLSRVFGELFSLLEEEYRYFIDDDGNPHNEKGITLPNGETFVIPKNLYIIGTMNDIDRSVESMDFALRRRFAWYEVTAASSRHIIRDKVKNATPEVLDKLEAAMDALNGMIAPKPKKSKTEDSDVPQKQTSEESIDLRLGSEYQLGGAIFAKYEKYAGDADAFGKLWKNHIENILSEYLRGRRDRKDILDELEEKYKNATEGQPAGANTSKDAKQDEVKNP